jgi:hypothetical protein
VRLTRNCSATSTLDKPSAQASTIRQRNANACAELARRAHLCNVSRSWSLRTNPTLDRPRPAILESYNLMANFRRRTLDAVLQPGLAAIGARSTRAGPQARLALCRRSILPAVGSAATTITARL